jgi:hypothetical protein
MHWADRIGRQLKLRDLHILLAVVQCGTMSKAAGQLSVSKKQSLTWSTCSGYVFSIAVRKVLNRRFMAVRFSITPFPYLMN